MSDHKYNSLLEILIKMFQKKFMSFHVSSKKEDSTSVLTGVCTKQK